MVKHEPHLATLSASCDSSTIVDQCWGPVVAEDYNPEASAVHAYAFRRGRFTKRGIVSRIFDHRIYSGSLCDFIPLWDAQLWYGRSEHLIAYHYECTLELHGVERLSRHPIAYHYEWDIQSTSGSILSSTFIQ